jgi:hypothetical protein
MLRGLIKFIVVEGKTYVSVNMIFYNGTNLTKKENINQFSQTLFVTGNM